MTRRFLVATFDNDNAAFDAANDLDDLAAKGVVKIERAAIATKNEDGTLSIPEARNVGKSWGILGSGGVIGELLGLFLGNTKATADFRDSVDLPKVGDLGGDVPSTFALGLDEQSLKDIGSELETGQTVLLAEADDDGATESVDRAITRRGGRVFRTERPNVPLGSDFLEE